MSISKVRLPNNTEEDIKAKYLIQSSSSDAVSAEFSARTVTEDAIANIQKIYGNTVAVSDNLDSNSATAILSRGFNQWDEEWEAGGINATTGQNDSTSNIIRAKNYTPVTGGQSYYIYMGSARASQAISMRYYDANKNLIGTTDKNGSSNGANLVRVMPDNCTYIRFVTSSYYGSSTTYLNDICINISDPAKNGTYEPYNGHQIDLNIPTLTGKLNGAGSSVVIFPDGMGYDGTNRDELTRQKADRKTGSGNLGSLSYTYYASWNNNTNIFIASLAGIARGTLNMKSAEYTATAISSSMPDQSIASNASNNNIYIRDTGYSDAATFKTAMSGVRLVYELATPQEYILDNALQLQYPVIAGGTEMVLPTSGTAPMKMDVIYGNAADATSNLSSNFISVDSMKAFLNNLGTQMGGTWNMQYNNGKFEFTFSSS